MCSFLNLSPKNRRKAEETRENTFLFLCLDRLRQLATARA